jgi:hypothetical protein
VLWRAVIALIVLAFSVIPARSGWAQISDVTPKLEVSTRDDFNRSRTELNEEVTNNFFIRQSHLLSLDVPLNPVFLLSYNMLYTDLDTRSDDRSEDGVKQITDTSNETFEPRAELLWDNPFFSWNNGFRFRKNDFESNDVGETRTQDNYFSRLRVDEDTYIPETKMRYEWTRRSDNLLVPETDTNENRLDVELTKHLGPFRANYDLRADRNDNDITNVIRDRVDQLGVITYSQSFFNNLISAFGEYQIEADRTITKTPPSGGTLEGVREAVDGLYLDGADTPDTPLDDELDSGFSDLIDSVTTVAADPPGTNIEVNLEVAFQNLGVRIQIAQEVNKIFVYVDRLPTSEAALDAIQWRVFFSNTSAKEWTEIVGVSSDFVTTDRRFEITLPSSTVARFFRVRNTSTTTEEILITEMRVVGEETFLEKVRRVEESYDQDATGRLTIQPLRFLSFIYDFFYSEINTRPQADQNLERFNSGTVIFNPHPIFSMTGRFQRAFFDLAGEDTVPETQDRYSAALTSTPLPTLTQSVAFTRLETSERQHGGEVDTGRDDTFFYTLTGEVFRGLTLGLDLDWLRAWDLEQRLPAEITSKATFRVDAQLRPDLRITGDYAAGRRGGGDLPSSERISTGEFLITFRPTPRINAESRFTFQTEEANKGLDHEYRINWIVFSGGNLDLVTDYRYERTEDGGEEEHRGGVTVHWMINSKTILDLGWSILSENNGDRLLRHTGTVSFIIRL